MADLTLTYEKIVNGIAIGDDFAVTYKSATKNFKVDSFEKREITIQSGTTGYTYVRLSEQP